MCVSAWLVPGLGHVMLGKRYRGAIFFGVVLSLFALGLSLDGELFPLDRSELLTSCSAGLAELGVGLAYFVVDLLVGGGATSLRSPMNMDTRS